MAIEWSDAGTTYTRVMRKLREKKEGKMPKKKISRTEENLISEKIRERLREELGVYLLDLVVVDNIIDKVIKEVLGQHFKIEE